MLFKTKEKHIVVTKRRREMYIMHTTHFHIKQWQFLFLMLLRFAQKKPACVLLSKHLQYKYTRNSKTINKLTINLFAHLTQ